MTGTPTGPELSARLSRAARTVWAKSDRDTSGWMPLWRHMADSGAVAGLLWDGWLPRNVRELIADTLGGSQVLARELAVWLATVHDVGKATPAFACQVDGLAENMRAAGLAMRDPQQYGDDRRTAPHGLAGQLILQEWLVERHEWKHRTAGQLAVVVGGHHGVPPGHGQLHDLELREDLIRTPGASEKLWRDVQFELLDACTAVLGTVDVLRSVQGAKLPQPVQVLLTGIVIMADWIASNPDLFPYFPEERPRSEAERIQSAWQGLNLPPAWDPSDPPQGAKELLEARFELPAGGTPRPVQEEAVRLARELAAPGLLVIEAPMGEGKTEAALAVAEVFAARTGAGGCYVALPTRATANAMFPRLTAWLNHLPADGDRTVFLAHAKAALNDEYAGMMAADRRRIAAVDTDGSQGAGHRARRKNAGLIAHQWLRGRKKGLLASFAVGTIDQVLFAGLKNRHLALRHLALAGKVVVIDEVHANDAYMNTYLERVLSWLGAYRVPVVMLSATLPAATRRALVQAYCGAAAEAEVATEEPGYPLLTAVAPGHPPLVRRPAADSARRSTVHLEPLDDELNTLVDRLSTELADGGCALVVRNTVDRVLEAADRLRERFGDEAVTVAHARFVDLDRARKDSDLLDRFGPTGDRPRGPHIVVASQVAEQSLDVDFDLLVTDLCPMDLVLQRMGRLHRHRRGEGQGARPARLRTARCLVTGVDWAAQPLPGPVKGSTSVYGRHHLLRSAAVLWPHLVERVPLTLPDDINGLVQRAYGGEPVGPSAWSAAMAEAAEEQRLADAAQTARAEVFRLDEVRRPGRSLVGWLDAGVGDVDDHRSGQAQVRDGEESLEVMVAMRHPDGSLTTVPWLDRGRGGLPLPTETVPGWNAAQALAASSLRLPYHFSKPWVIDKAIKELEQLYVPAWQVKECPQLDGELVLLLDEHGRAELAGFELEYNPGDGLSVHPAGAREVRLVKNVPSFDLVSRPWLPVQRLDGTTAELSLREVFAEAAAVRRLVGDVPTQEFALMRLLLAILHDAVDGPAELEDWEELWEDPGAFAAVGRYLDRHRERFDLLHPETPFFQVPELRTEKDEVASLNRLVADVPNGDPFFSMRMPSVDRLAFAEAARWLVHAHAFDTSGIKSAAAGDGRAKGGKVYPLGTGWAGGLGGVLAEGDDLRQTLLLNLVAADTAGARFREEDRPSWRRGPYGPEPDPEAADPSHRPSGPRDLYTWQSRRIRLHHDGSAVTGAVLSYGDPLAAHDRRFTEPLTGWRRSRPQEKKLGRVPVYLPRQHDPARSAWRGLPALLQKQTASKAAKPGEPAEYLSPLVLEWVARLTTERALERGRLIRARTIGAMYGTQQSVFDEVVDDGVAMAVILLHEGDQRYGRQAVSAVEHSEDGVKAVVQLAADLADAAGAAADGPKAAAAERGYADLDVSFRLWLGELGQRTHPDEALADWRRQARRILLALGSELVDTAPQAAREGRVVAGRSGRVWLNDALAFRRFGFALAKALPAPDPPAVAAVNDDNSTEGEDR
ncbi:type I-E CRISPR-associated protein Cse1/CasA [Kitasatospora purpeofusca]|uniref:type I-E CRISPR-associated protein Cse1/CasA n=1 Tax=Kitasatospora purpeofusca TaxID=67352 RepID=UPI00068BB9D9|nr:type I-E CRISPR-associated protein Cse1/CasA [Kitasatospora purpeofusca]